MCIKLIIYHLSLIIGKSRGFTLIELMIAISITAVLGTLGIAGFNNYNKTQVLKASISEVVTMLNLAKSRAQSQIKPPDLCPEANNLNGYTVRFTAPLSYKMELNCSNGTNPTVSQQDKKLPSSLKFGASSSFFFPVQKGGVSAPGRITVSNANGSNPKTIIIDALGRVSVWLSTTCPDWDVNCNSPVNSSDVSIISSHFNETGSYGWIKADVNKDGVVDQSDLDVVIVHYLQSW